MVIDLSIRGMCVSAYCFRQDRHGQRESGIVVERLRPSVQIMNDSVYCIEGVLAKLRSTTER